MYAQLRLENVDWCGWCELGGGRLFLVLRGMDVLDCSLSLTTATLKTHTVPHPEQKFKIPPLFFTGRKLRPAGIGIEAPASM